MASGKKKEDKDHLSNQKLTNFVEPQGTHFDLTTPISEKELQDVIEKISKLRYQGCEKVAEVSKPEKPKSIPKPGGNLPPGKPVIMPTRLNDPEPEPLELDYSWEIDESED